MQISKRDAREALAHYHFGRPGDFGAVISRLRSVQFDPLAPIGSNHDLVLQARVPGYQVGDWQNFAYKSRLVYDGWDKQACLICADGWADRRIFHDWQRHWFDALHAEHPEALDAVLGEIREKGPMLPRQFEFQDRRDDWEGSWFGPSVTKRALKALWYAGKIMTADRRGSHHIYDLTERVIPQSKIDSPRISEDEAIKAIFLDRHKAMGIIRPSAQYEVWSMATVKSARRMALLKELVSEGKIIPVAIEGVAAHAHPDFLVSLGEKPSSKVTFVAPLDPFMWDRKMISHLFGFEYVWEVYVPESKRRWGYYVLPILYGDSLVGRIEFFARKGVLEVRALHWEAEFKPNGAFENEFQKALNEIKNYAGMGEFSFAKSVPETVQEWWKDSLT